MNAHRARHAIRQRLRGEHMLDLRCADAEAERAERAVGGGMAIAAQHDHAGADQARLGRDDVLDALQRIVDVEQFDAVARAVAREIGSLARGGVDRDHAFADRIGFRRNHVIDDAHLLLRPQYADTAFDEPVERLRARVLVHDVQVRVKQDVLRVETGHGVRLDELLIQRARHISSNGVGPGVDSFFWLTTLTASLRGIVYTDGRRI